MAEAAVVSAGQRVLKRRGAWGLNVHGTGHGRRGTPDWVGVYRGQGVAIEWKAPGGRLTRLQAHELQRAERAGAFTCVARCADDVEELLDEIDRRIATWARAA